LKLNRETTKSSKGQFKITFAQIVLAPIALLAFEAAIAAPTQAQIDRALEPLVSCNFDQRKESNDDAVVFKFLEEQREKKYGNGQTGRFDVNFKSNDVQFNRLDSYSGPGGAFQIMYASAATPQQLENLMRSKGWQFSRVDGKAFQSSQPIAQALKMDMQNTLRVVVLPGLHSFTPNESNLKGKGASVICHFSSTKESDWNNQSGLPTSDQMLRLDQDNKPYPSAWIEPIIAKGNTSAKLAIASKTVLTDNQVHRLWQVKEIQQQLITSKFDQLTSEHLLSLVRDNQDYLVEYSIAQKLARLPEAYTAKLKTIPKYARMLATANRQPEAVDDLVQALKNKDEANIYRFVALYGVYDDLVVDAIFTHGTDRWKQEAADRRVQKFTPAQIERALTDPSEEVQIWMLRRKDVEITRAQYDRGLQSKQRNVAFWYQQISIHAPTGSQIDEGLDSPNEPTRWSWANRKDIVLTPSQLAKLLKDPVPRVRYSIWSRSEWVPTEADIDRCFAELTGYAMRTCFSKTEFEIKPKWFSLIVRNWNRNVIRAWYEHPKFSAAVHAQLLNDLALQADDSLLNNLMNANDLMFNEQQVLSFPSSVTPNTKRQYCSRKKINCS
jgi:cytidylate kinase